MWTGTLVRYEHTSRGQLARPRRGELLLQLARLVIHPVRRHRHPGPCTSFPGRLTFPVVDDMAAASLEYRCEQTRALNEVPR